MPWSPSPCDKTLARRERTELGSSVTKDRGSAKRSLKDLVYVGVRQRLQSLRPLRCHTPPLALRTHLTVPANLLHVVVQLNTVPIRIEGVRDVVRTE